MNHIFEICVSLCLIVLGAVIHYGKRYSLIVGNNTNKFTKEKLVKISRGIKNLLFGWGFSWLAGMFAFDYFNLSQYFKYDYFFHIHLIFWCIFFAVWKLIYIDLKIYK